MSSKSFLPRYQWLLKTCKQKETFLVCLLADCLSLRLCLIGEQEENNTVLQVDQGKALKQILEPDENATTLLQAKIESGLHLHM